MNGTEDFCIVACDGLWDTVTPDEATACVFNQLQKNKGKFLSIFQWKDSYLEFLE